MASAMSVKLFGARKLHKKLLALEPKIAKKYLRSAMRAGAKPIHADAKQRAPRDTGFGASQIKVRAATKLRRGNIGVVVTAAGGKSGNQGDAYYMYFHEMGYLKQETRRLPDGTFVSLPRGQGTPVAVPPRPFMRPAFEDRKEHAARIIETKLWSAIKAEATKSK